MCVCMYFHLPIYILFVILVLKHFILISSQVNNSNFLLAFNVRIVLIIYFCHIYLHLRI